MVDMNAGGNSMFAKQGQEFKDKADKTLSGSFFSNLFGSKDDRKSDAKDLYLKAANCFKLAEDKYQAVDMYLKCVEMEENPSQKGNHFKEAAGQFQGLDTQKYC